MKKKTTRKYNCKRKVNITRKRKNLNLITKKKLKCKKNQLGGDDDKKFNRTHALPLLKYCLDLHHAYEEKMNELIKSLEIPSYKMGELKKIHDDFNDAFNYEKTHNDGVNEKEKEESIKGLAKTYDIQKRQKYKEMFFEFLEKLKEIHDDVFGNSLFNYNGLYSGYYNGSRYGSRYVSYTKFLNDEMKIIDDNGYYNLPKDKKDYDFEFKRLYKDILSHEPNKFIKSVNSKMEYYYNGNFEGVSYTESENWFNNLIKNFIKDSYFIYMIDERYNFGKQTCNKEYSGGNKLSPLYYFYNSIRSYISNREKDDTTFGVQLHKCLKEIKKIKVGNLKEIYNVFITDESNGQKEMDTCQTSIKNAQNYNLNKYSQGFKDYIEYFDTKSKKSPTFNDVDLSDFIFNICLYKRSLVNNRTDYYLL